MGLFDFVKAAGQKLGLVDEDDDAEKATALKKEIDKYDLGSDKIDVTVAGDKVLLKGEAPSQEALEKIVLAAGNVEGVGKVETDVAAPEAREPVFHTVKKGESLWKIAEEHYGKGSRYTEIFEANRPMLSDPDKIYPGQTLRIP
ncbi:MAG: peptidoglycan-binding protein LysM [Bauldia sp.]|uniref:peptidoglycan-binding protein LysM n=1 Tax=Bauldia sp. TaxID=2575872 RepID=UPI001D60609A|nr:peptidoglycan-binding protein LysM [Bauldia sp.]MCB1497252.1 peptidoglycan-binding protein LysM [Bauldia sp.]